MRRVIVITAVLLTLIGCGSEEPDAKSVDVRVGDETVQAEVVSEAAEREQGLAGRASLAEDRGMLFVYPDRAERNYWMKGMRFPIDIVWIDQGRVTGVERDVPVPVDGRFPIYSSRAPADRVLEVRAGWAARHGVEPGDRVTVSSGS
jgi:uncharacterized protein